MEEFGKHCQVEKVLKYLIEENILSKENPCGLFIDHAVLLENMKELQSSFHEPFFHHRYAVKANPIKAILKTVKDFGFGVECASFGEVSINIFVL